MDHLSDIAKATVSKSIQERIEYIDSRIWIPYPNSVAILKKFNSFLTRPKVERMPNIFLTGDSNNGKTELLHEFDKKFQPYIIPGIGPKLDVLLIQAPPRADEARLYGLILKKLNVAHSWNEKVSKKYYQVEQVLSSLDVKILIIDEIHNIITGTYNKQREFLTVLKFLTNQLKIILIVAGTKDARRVINTDEQLANRFQPIELPRWSLNKEYLQLLASFESKLPLKKPSNLVSRDLATKIFDMSEGLLGEISWIIKESAKLAIENGDEIIEGQTIDAIDYVSPSQRRKI